MSPDEYCQQKAAQSGSSFYYSFLFLPPERRRAITALYAFCREVDDTVDDCTDEAVARTKLAWWRKEIAAMLNGNPTHPVSNMAPMTTAAGPIRRAVTIAGPFNEDISVRLMERKRGVHPRSLRRRPVSTRAPWPDGNAAWRPAPAVCLPRRI